MSDVKRCAACRKEKPVSEMKTCMHAEMHNYVCDSKCMRDFYNPPKAEKPDYNALLAERDQLRAELDAIRGQQIVGRVHHNPDHPEPVRAVLNSAGRQLPDDARLYALPPQQPDAVSVPRELEALQAECDNLRISLKDADHGMVLFMQQRDELREELETLKKLAVRIVKADPSIGSSSGQLVDGWAAMEELRALLSTRQAEEDEPCAK